MPGGIAHTNKRLRVAVVAPPWFEVPPVGYGGIEALLADLVNGLGALGHEVTLIGAGQDHTNAKRFIAAFDEPPSHLLGDPVIEVLHAASVAQALTSLDVDLVHDNTLAGPLLARGSSLPTVVTVHGPVNGNLRRYFRALGQTASLVAISEAQRRRAPELNWGGRVHNGIDVASFPFHSHKDDYVLFLGRLNPEKGVHIAIDVARAAGVPIVVAAKCNEPDEKAYFAAQVEPRLGPDVVWYGEADTNQKRGLLAGARCLVFPIQWEEPFGMVMIEAMACGTPVVALRRGSVPEIVRDGVTGLIVDRPGELSAAIASVGRLNPADCRSHVERYFNTTSMAAGYETIYRKLVEQVPDDSGPAPVLAA